MAERKPIAAAAVAVLLLVAGAAGAWLARAEEGRVPPGVEIGGVDVGGRAHEEARVLLLEASDDRYEQPILLCLGDTTLETTPRRLGAEPAVEDAFAEADDRRGALGRLAARLRLVGPVQVPLEHRVDEAALEEELERVAGEVEQEPRPAAVEVAEGEVRVVPGQPGLELQRDELAGRLAELPREAEIPVEERSPAVSDEEAERAAAEARALLDEHRRRSTAS
jgi:hypothetical protein